MPIKTSTEWQRLANIFFGGYIFFAILFFLFLFNLAFDDFLSLDKETQTVFLNGKNQSVIKDAGTIYRYVAAVFCMILCGAAFIGAMGAKNKSIRLINKGIENRPKPSKELVKQRRLVIIFTGITIVICGVFVLSFCGLIFDVFTFINGTHIDSKTGSVVKNPGSTGDYLLLVGLGLGVGILVALVLSDYKKYKRLLKKEREASKPAPPKPVAPSKPVPPKPVVTKPAVINKPAVISVKQVPAKPNLAQQQKEREAKERELKQRTEEFWKPTSELEQHLQTIADSFLPLFDNMPRIKIRVLNEPIDGTPNGRRAVAYCHYANGPFEKYVVIKKDFLICANIEAVENIVQHELIHAWSHWKGFKDNGEHGPIFKAKAQEIGCLLSTEIV